MEGTGTDEQHVVGLHRPILGGDGRAFDQRQQVALHAFAADRAATDFGIDRDLVNLVEEDDAVVLDPLDGGPGQVFLVDQVVGLFLDQLFVGVFDLELALDLALPQAAEHVAEVDHPHLRTGHAGDIERWHDTAGFVVEVDFDFAVVELALAQHLAELLLGVVVGLSPGEHVDQTVFSDDLGLGLNGVALLGAGAGYGQLNQIADDGLDVAADVADLGELGSLNLDERRVGELGQPAGNLGLAAAGRPDHQDVLG